MWLLAVISLATIAITCAAGTVRAAPAASGTVQALLSMSSNSVLLDIRDGSASVDSRGLSIRNTAGQEVLRMPLHYRVENRQFPIDPTLSGNRVHLTPSKNVARSTLIDPVQINPLRAQIRHLAAGPATRQERDDQALNRFSQQLAAGMTVSSLIGTAIGALLGGFIGCALGIVAAVVGCLVGVAPAAAIGGIIGMSLGGGGTVIIAGLQYLQTIQSPFKPPRR